MPFVRPTRYVIEYTDRQQWEKLHRAPSTEPADPVDFRVFLDVKTLQVARKEVVRLLEKWPFAQPVNPATHGREGRLMGLQPSAGGR